MPSTILVVDDEPHHREICAALLRHFGYRVLHAGTGEEGIRLAEDSHPDLILLDLWMPGIGGVEALRRLKQNPATAGIPVVAVTADVLRIPPSVVLQEGFSGHLAKPCRPREILLTVQRFIGLPAAHAG